MQIEVHSRATIKKFTADVPYIVISIRGYNDRDPAKLADCKNRVDVLELAFDDLNIDTGPDIFQDSHAIRIRDFVVAYLDIVSLIVCQCEAGISRSAAVAASLSLWLNQTDKPFTDGSGPNGRFFPNGRVLRVMKSILFPPPFSTDGMSPLVR